MSGAVWDGNRAAAEVAYACNEVIAIYPITPASPMGEQADQWSSEAQTNLWGQVPRVVEMQSEGGAAGVVHGSLQSGSLTTTFTSSQGLLLMLPNMFKIAGELTSAVFHIAARALATHALSIFGDHSDVMAVRSAGWAMLFAASVQEAHDFAAVAQRATLLSRIPFLHIQDGFRTSHEENKIDPISREDLLSLMPAEPIAAHRARGLTPEHPTVRGTAQNPDTFFQSREAANSYYERCPAIAEEALAALAERTGRVYHLFDYVGDPQAEHVIVAMGSGCSTIEETVAHLQGKQSVGLLKVRLYRPFSVAHFLKALPDSVRKIAVLDRCREPGGVGEPLFQDVVAALASHPARPQIIGGRYGLGSKEFTPAMVLAVFAEMAKEKPRSPFVVGIQDDLGGLSLDYDRTFHLEDPESVRAIFWGLGSDGTVGANKNSIKIIGEETEAYAQGYFVYDSKKSGARTVSHLRFGPKPILKPYLIQRASFVAIHQFELLRRYPVFEELEPGGTVLINSPYPVEETWSQIPPESQTQLLAKRPKIYVIDATQVARTAGMAGRINTVMQTCFFELSGVLPRERAQALIKGAIQATYGKQGQTVIQKNFAAVEASINGLRELSMEGLESGPSRVLPPKANVQSVEERLILPLIREEGETLPCSAFPIDGCFPTGTARLEKRNLSIQVPVLAEELCIQCGKCVYVCPHSVIRAKVVNPERLQNAPEGFVSMEAAWKEYQGQRYTLQVSLEDCTGCQLCVEVCPGRDKTQVGRKALAMAPQEPLREQGKQNWEFFLQLPDHPEVPSKPTNVKNLQLHQPLFEFSGACSGCGETPYLRVLSQLFGERMVIANATGCSSIYGANLPTTPWSKNAQGRGPAWANSLFEDNAEFGLGMRLAYENQRTYARRLALELLPPVDSALLLDEEAPAEERRAALERVRQLPTDGDPRRRDLVSLADALMERSTWIIGGDGWAYDIGYGGLDHILAGSSKVHVLVLDTEVYSNTGGQSSKSTPLGAVAKFAAGGKATAKKDLGLLAMAYGTCYVASIAMGANEGQTIKAFQEAESFPGPSIILAYSQCIAHGIDMAKGMNQQKLAVESGAWLLYRYDPRRREQGLAPLQLDSKPPSRPLKEYMYNEGRFRILANLHPEDAAHYYEEAQAGVQRRWKLYQERALQG